MNIFFLDQDIKKCARYHCDKHVVKMILEYAQLLCSAHRLLDNNDNPNLYKMTHKNHPCTIWTISANSHYIYLYKLFIALSHEYTYRYEKTHKSYEKMHLLLKNPPLNIKNKQFEDPPKVMPLEYSIYNTTIDCYRAYYASKKLNFNMTYKKRLIPFFML